MHCRTNCSGKDQFNHSTFLITNKTTEAANNSVNIKDIKFLKFDIKITTKVTTVLGNIKNQKELMNLHRV